MGDLESGFEEMDGVKLGYLIIKGKQMFALSQVFTDLLKNIPRTTVHKRMDHLNVKKHHCDLEELRKLKAINSIAFHAAKCTLISREDVEALYISCKTERVLKTKRRRINANSSEDVYDEPRRPDPHNSFWKEKVWLSLHGVPQPFSFKSKTGQQEEALLPPASNLPQIYSKCASHLAPAVVKSPCKNPQNYETAQIASNCVAFNAGHSFFRNVVCSRQPVLYQSAIAAQTRLSSATDLTRKRRRAHGSAGKPFCNTSKSTRRVLLVPKCCKSKVSNGPFNKFQVEHGLYLDHHHHHLGGFQESYSSDTESSSYSERADNDSDFGSSLSTTSNSGTSDEEEEEDSLSESSDASSDEESSSESDSSSVSSQVSVQSIRFRRTSFSPPNNKTPLVAQPSFHYTLQHRAAHQGTSGGLDYGISNRKLQKSDIKLCMVKKPQDVSKQNKHYPATLASLFSESRRDRVSEIALSHFEITDDPKRTDPTINCVKERGSSPCPKENKDFSQQRILGQANKCLQAFIPHCARDKETIVPQHPDNHPSLALNFKKEAKISNCSKLPPPSSPVKTEAEEHNSPPNSHAVKTNAGKSPPTFLPHVKIKVEENFDEYTTAGQFSETGAEYKCVNKEDPTTKHNHLNGEAKPIDTLNNANKTTASTESPATSPKSPSRNQDFQSTLRAPHPEEGEYKNGARVRKNYRTLVLGKQSGIQRTPLKLNVKADRTPRSSGKNEFYEGSLEDLTGTGKRKRTPSNVAAVKKPFNFMANFPSPPSLIIGHDGDLSPAYSLNSVKDDHPPHRSHPVWKWQLGGSAVPLPPSHKFRKFNV
ncbi:SKI/DACH domain-containing protein 1 [Amia ocellicauda]|uniref:SKI/DACH domain-containing protein 1 n=1 Tax=Amia ocellicauda TaxID=2972642 RepID=UPI00346456DE